MTEFTQSIVIGTAATVLAVLLLLLRIRVQGQRPVLVLTQQWVATGTRTSCLVLAFVSVIAAYSFANVVASKGLERDSSMRVHGTASDSAGDHSEATDLNALRAYANNIEGKPGAASEALPVPTQLQDVESMIANLVARLKQQPDDVKGWKMLGWSYLNTDKFAEAVRAYQTALKLAPDDVEAQKALEAAKSASGK